jgi:sugar/nucleoside kinase (ribokinase family)
MNLSAIAAKGDGVGFVAAALAAKPIVHLAPGLRQTGAFDMAEVICIGMACADVAVRGVDNNRAPASVEGRIPVEGVTITGGGDALNESIVLGRLGHHVQLMAGCGRDAAGTVMRYVISQAGVDTSLFVEDGEYSTPVSVLLIDAEGERKILSVVPGGAGSFIAKKRYTLDPSRIGNARVVSLASLFNAPLDDTALVARIAKEAKARGAVVCADTKPLRRELSLADYREALPYVDFIFPNEEETALYAPGCATPREAAAHFQSFGVKNVLMKMGAQGVHFFGEGEDFHVPAFKVEAVDTTGCGDNFAAGFISGLLQGMDMRGCCEFACAAASICAQTLGASTGVVSMEQVRRRLHEGRAGRL